MIQDFVISSPPITLHNRFSTLTNTSHDMEDKRQMTMKDIARELGVSVATVSRALSDSPSISRERRLAIQQFAREHNYFPNVIAEQL